MFLRYLISLATLLAVLVPCQGAAEALVQLVKTRDFEAFQLAMEASGGANFTDERCKW